MQYLNLTFALLAFLAWGGLFFVYYRERIIPWFINRFTRDSPQKANEEKHLFDGAAPLPFKYKPEERPQTKHEKEISLIETDLQVKKEASMKEEKEISALEKSKKDNTSS